MNDHANISEAVCENDYPDIYRNFFAITVVLLEVQLVSLPINGAERK